jgi:hypothetical protein
MEISLPIKEKNTQQMLKSKQLHSQLICLKQPNFRKLVKILETIQIKITSEQRSNLPEQMEEE